MATMTGLILRVLQHVVFLARDVPWSQFESVRNLWLYSRCRLLEMAFSGLFLPGNSPSGATTSASSAGQGNMDPRHPRNQSLRDSCDLDYLDIS